MIKKRISLRNRFDKEINEWRSDYGVKADGNVRSVRDLVSGYADADNTPGHCTCSRESVFISTTCRMLHALYLHFPTPPPSILPCLFLLQDSIIIAARSKIMTAGIAGVGQAEAELLAEMVAFGDSGGFLDRVSCLFTLTQAQAA